MTIENKLGLVFSSAHASNFKGHDPYDGLNSRLFRALGMHHSAFLRLVWIQLFKRNPVNLRALAGVPKTFNAKAGALFLMGALRQKNTDSQTVCGELVKRLLECAIRTRSGWAWGYPFDWQAKAFYVPQGTPNVVTTVYVGNALLDSYKLHKDVTLEAYIKGARDFILDEMIIWEKNVSLCFAYIPGKKTEVHNANLLAAAFVSRVEKVWPRSGAKEKVKKAAHFSLADIGDDGHWPYGTEKHHRWMDNFHTGFNIEALLTVRKLIPDPGYDKALRRIVRVYVNDFFTDEGVPKYYRKALYPIDSHTLSESILVLTKVGAESDGLFDEEVKRAAEILCEKVLTYTFKEFWNEQGYFYYQKSKWGMNRIPYIRWSQAWMYYALSMRPEFLNSKVGR